MPADGFTLSQRFVIIPGMSAKIIKEERLHKSFHFNLDRLTLQTHAGQEINRDVIRHPGAALILPILTDGSMVLIRNYRYPAADYLVELPCGTIDNGEPPIECARRELLEETGYTAEIFEELASWYSCPGYSDEVIYAFVASGLKRGSQKLEEYEDISVIIRSDAEVRNMLADNQIRDAKTISALGTYWIRKELSKR